MTKRMIRVGSRESRLAVVQARLVMDAIAAAHPELELELVTMKTTGDKILDRTLDKVGGKGLFVRELDRALRDGIIDISVHSLKDVPMELPGELPLLAFCRREAPLDALVLPKGADMMPDGPIGSSSPRRRVQLGGLFPDREVQSVRGNVLTRLEKLDNGEYAALVLASAGLRRLGLEGRISREFSAAEMIPAAGQGILAIQGRAGEDTSFLDCVSDAGSTAAALAERAFVRELDGGCSSPIAAYAQIQGDTLRLRGLFCSEDEGTALTGEILGTLSQAQQLGIQLAHQLRQRALCPQGRGGAGAE